MDFCLKLHVLFIAEIIPMPLPRKLFTQISRKTKQQDMEAVNFKILSSFLEKSAAVSIFENSNNCFLLRNAINYRLSSNFLILGGHFR